MAPVSRSPSFPYVKGEEEADYDDDQYVFHNRAKPGVSREGTFQPDGDWCERRLGL